MSSRSRKSFENLNFEAEILENQRNFAHVKRLLPFPPYLGRGILRGQPLSSRKSFWKIGIWGGNIRKSEEFCTRKKVAPPSSRLVTISARKSFKKLKFEVEMFENQRNFLHVFLLALIVGIHLSWIPEFPKDTSCVSLLMPKNAIMRWNF